jgi:hypothetical protein
LYYDSAAERPAARHFAMPTHLRLRHPLSGLLAVLCLHCTLVRAADAEPVPPKLVVVIVVDGLPHEQVLRYRDQFSAGGFRRLLDQGAWFGNAHQAHGITVTAVGHSAVLTGAYAYRHGIIGNSWINPAGATVYCTEDARYHYLGEQETDPHDGTSPANLRVDTLGDELRYATGGRAKVLTVSGKDRGAILLAGKTGTAYIYMEQSGNFATSTYYMDAYPAWARQARAARAADRYYGKRWTPLLPAAAYAGDADDPAPTAAGSHGFPITSHSASGHADRAYYEDLKLGPVVDELTLEFARAAVAGEGLGHNPAGVPDLLGISLSDHDYVNHAFGPESRMSHDHLQRLDRMLGGFFDYLDRQVGKDQYLVVLTADHGFGNTPEFSRQRGIEARRIDPDGLLKGLDQALATHYGASLTRPSMLPDIRLDDGAMARLHLERSDVEDTAARWLLNQPGVAQVYTRTQFEHGGVAGTRTGLLMQRAWNQALSGDVLVVPQAFSLFSAASSGTSHGTPYAYDTLVPLMIMGPRWIRPGARAEYAEVVDIAPTLAYLLRIRPPAGAEGRVLAPILRQASATAP